MDLKVGNQANGALWEKARQFVLQTVGKKPHNLNEMLFIIGVQELGAGKRSFSKEEKQDIMHIASCKLMSYGGYYSLLGYDEDSWPHWQLIKKLPSLTLREQEELLKFYIIEYFRKELGLHI